MGAILREGKQFYLFFSGGNDHEANNFFRFGRVQFHSMRGSYSSSSSWLRLRRCRRHHLFEYNQVALQESPASSTLVNTWEVYTFHVVCEYLFCSCWVPGSTWHEICRGILDIVILVRKITRRTNQTKQRKTMNCCCSAAKQRATVVFLHVSLPYVRHAHDWS